MECYRELYYDPAMCHMIISSICHDLTILGEFILIKYRSTSPFNGNKILHTLNDGHYANAPTYMQLFLPLHNLRFAYKICSQWLINYWTTSEWLRYSNLFIIHAKEILRQDEFIQQFNIVRLLCVLSLWKSSQFTHKRLDVWISNSFAVANCMIKHDNFSGWDKISFIDNW